MSETRNKPNFTNLKSPMYRPLSISTKSESVPNCGIEEITNESMSGEFDFHFLPQLFLYMSIMIRMYTFICRCPDGVSKKRQNSKAMGSNDRILFVSDLVCLPYPPVRTLITTIFSETEISTANVGKISPPSSCRPKLSAVT